MKDKYNMKKTAIIVVIIAAALVGLMIFSKSNQQPGAKKTQTEAERKADLTKPYETERMVKEEAQVLLTGFPQGFPVEAGSQSSESFKYVPAQSVEQQSTVVYASKKTLAENGKTFRDYMASAGFEIINKDERDDGLFYYATKDNNDLSIKIDEKNGQVSVSATYLKR